MHNFAAILTVPSQGIHTVRGTRLFEHYPHGVGEADGVVGRVGREEKHAAFVDGDVAVDRFERR